MKKRLLSFGAVGVFNTVINVAVFNLLILNGISVGLSNLLSIILSIIFAYLLSKHIVFGDRKNNASKDRFIKFIAVNILTLFVIHQILLLFFAYYLTLPGDISYEIFTILFGDHFSELFVKANTYKLLAVLGSMTTSYFLYDRFVFDTKSNNRHESI